MNLILIEDPILSLYFARDYYLDYQFARIELGLGMQEAQEYAYELWLEDAEYHNIKEYDRVEYMIDDFLGRNYMDSWLIAGHYLDELRPSSVKEMRRREKSLRVQNRRRRRGYYQGYAPWNLTKRFGTRNYEYPEWHPSHWSHEEVPMGFYFKNKLKTYLDPWGYSEHHNVNALRQPQMWDGHRIIGKSDAY